MATLNIEILKTQKMQETYLNKINDEINIMPKGVLYYSIRGPRCYYYQSIVIEGARQKKYLSLKDSKHSRLISDLKRKRFLLICKKVLEGNVIALRACLLKYEEFDPTQINSRLAATYENIKDVTTLKQEQQNQQGDQDKQNMRVEDWQHAPYPRATMHADNLKHEAIGGLMVRSKSEALIAFALDLAHIPFHYEEILEFDNKKIAPDFTILHPSTGERIYWEHFGMMDDADYATETFKKLIAYGQNGIMPGKNLIYTMESNVEPLSIRAIQGMITHYLLA